MVFNISGRALSTYKNYADVTLFGAIGDGIADDTLAIQSAIDSVSVSGGFIYFPAGVYKITQYLVYYSNQTLWFDGATLLQGAEINGLLLARCPSGTTGYNGTHDVLIHGAIFDGGDYSINNTLSGCVHAKNITYEDCIFKNAYGTWHDLEFNSTYNGKIIRCDFEGNRKTGGNACLIQLDAIDRNAVYPWSNDQGAFDNTVCKYIEIASCIFHDDTISPAIGNHNNYAQLYVNIHDCVFDGFTAARGAINFQLATEVDIYNNQFNGCTIGVGSGGETYYIRNNRFNDVTTPSAVLNSIFQNNIVNSELKSQTIDKIDELKELINENYLSETINPLIVNGVINVVSGIIDPQASAELFPKRLRTDAITGSKMVRITLPIGIGFCPVYYDNNDIFISSSGKYLWESTTITLERNDYIVRLIFRNTAGNEILPSDLNGLLIQLVYDQNGQIDVISKKISPMDTIIWENGGIITTGSYMGTNHSNMPTRVRTRDYIPVWGGATIETSKPKNGGITPLFYDDELNCIAVPSPSAYLHSYTVPEKTYKYMRLMLKLDGGDRELTQQDGEANVIVRCGILQYERNPFKGKTLIFTGDSIPQGQISGGTVAVPYPQIVALQLGMTLKNYSIGATTIAAKTNYGTAFATLSDFEAATKDTSKYYQVISGQSYQTYKYADGAWTTSGSQVRTPLCERFQLMDDGDIVVAAAGTNDFQYQWTDIGDMTSRSNNTFYGAIHNICLGLLQKYFGKQIIFCTPLKRAQSPYLSQNDVNGNNKTLRDYCNIIKEVCAFYSIPVIDLNIESGLNPELSLYDTIFDSVHTHPLQPAHNILGLMIANKIKSLRW